MTFKEIKQEYEKQREGQRKELVRELAKLVGDQLRIVSGGRAGRGLSNYTAGGRIPPYDLSNWKWVELTDDSSFNCIISLNMKETDFNSGNSHFLYDRIGIYIEYKKGITLYQTQIFPNIELPLDEAASERIARYILEQYKIFQQKDV